MQRHNAPIAVTSPVIRGRQRSFAPRAMVHWMRCGRWVAAGMILLGLVGAARAQEALDDRVQQAAGNPASLYGRDSTQGVYVRDSAVAVEKFALAERLEHLKEWDKSADVYMEILQGYADRVVPSQVDEENRIYQYTSVAAAVQERLAKWPQAGLRVYRARYENEAEALLESADEDAARLHRVIALYFVTESAERAALRLMDLYLERADFPAAAWLGDRMLGWHPTLDEQRPKMLYRTAIAYHLAGDAAQARARLLELSEQFPAASGIVRGQEVKLGDSLAVELEQMAAPTLRVASRDSWPIAFGSPDRARVPAVSAAFGARLFAVEMPESLVRTPLAARRQVEQMNESDRKAGAMTGVFPAVDGGEMFFQDNARIYAVSLESGTPLPGWTETYDGQRNGQYLMSAFSTPRGQQCTITVTDDAVYAVMGQPDVLAMQLTGTIAPRGETRLVCLDRRTGRERWIASSRSLPPESGLARTLDFTGSPVVVGDTVYIMGRGGKGMQFEDSYVLAFDAASGKSKWACYLASANTGWWDFGDFSGLSGQRVSHLAYWGGRLYAITHLGALAAIDAYDGTIIWLNLYPRDVPEPNRMMGFHPAWNQRARVRARGGAISSGGSGAKPWTFNPVMVHNGKVFALPSDGLHVLIYDAATGIEQMRIPLSQFDDADTLLGVTDERLVLAAGKTVFCVNWPAYDEARGAEGNIFWRKSFAKAQYPEDAIRGRGFVTSDSVIIPTAWALHRLSMKDGRVEASYPDRAEFSEEEGPGNVLVMQDRLIVATPRRVNVYIDLRLAMEKLDAEVAAAPQQPEPRLRYAEIMSVAGKWDVSLAKLDEAARLLGGAGAGVGSDSPARDRLFSDALTFAQRVAREGGDAALAQASAFFDRAAAAASTPAQHVNYRLTRAKVMKGMLTPADELRLFQEILQDAGMRQVAVSASERTASTRPAAVVAERAITELLARNGRAIYEPYEAQATERLEAAQAGSDPAALLAIATEFPNAKVAPRALHAAADAYEAAQDPRLAAQVLRQMLFKYPDAPDRAKTIESLARNYLALPNRTEVAIARLAQGASRIPGARLSRPLRLPDGQVLENMSFADAVVALRQYNARDAARLLPDMKLPPLNAAEWKPGKSKFLPETPDSVIPGVAALSLPLPSFARHDRVVGFAPDRGLAVWEVGQTQPLFVSDALAQSPRGIAWSGNTLLAWTEAELAVLNGDDGQTVWKAALASLSSIEVVNPPGGAGDIVDVADEAADDPQAELLQQQRLELEGGVIIRGNRQIIVQGPNVQIRRAAIVPPPAAELAAAAAGPEHITQLRPLSDRVVFCTSTGRIVALDSRQGNVLWQIRPADRGPTHLLASDDFVVARLDDGARVQLLVLDALSGQFLSRRSFSNEDGSGRVPINVALAPDGTLVWILPDRLCGKDLFEPGDRLSFEELAQRDGQFTTFLGSTSPDHLQIADGRIFVLSDNGAYVRVYSLENGKPLRSRDADLFFATGAKPGTWQSVMRPFGRKLYIASPREMKSYDLENPAFNWNTQLSPVTTMRPRDLVVTPGYVLVISEPAGAAVAGAAEARRAGGGAGRAPAGVTTTLQLQPFSRAALDDRGRESGLLEQPQTITDPATILAWQPVHGGFYYLTGDQKLHFLQGAGK